MAKEFNGEYKLTTELGTINNGRTLELGHYVDGDKEFGEYVYIRSKYQNRKGEEKESVVSTKLTLKDLAEIQKIDLSGFDTESEATFD